MVKISAIVSNRFFYMTIKKIFTHNTSRQNY